MLGPGALQARRRPPRRSRPHGRLAGLISTLAFRPSSSGRLPPPPASVCARPRTRGANQAPASSARISAAVWRATRPRPSVVRRRVSSWISTGTPSRLSITSNSTQRAPSSCALRRPARVFSGALPAAPRWPITVASPGSAAVRPGDQGLPAVLAHRQLHRYTAAMCRRGLSTAGLIRQGRARGPRTSRDALSGRDRASRRVRGRRHSTAVLAGIVERVLFERPETGYRVLRVVPPVSATRRRGRHAAARRAGRADPGRGRLV